MNHLKPYLRKYRTLILLAVAVLFLEVFFFNYRFWDSLSSKPAGVIVETPGLIPTGGTGYKADASQRGLIRVSGFSEDVKYLYIDIICYNWAGDIFVPKMTLSATDEGHALPYVLGEVSSHPAFERTKYHRLYLYGKGSSVEITFQEAQLNANISGIEIREISVNKPVPMMFSVKRAGLIFLFAFLIWLFRPGAAVYAHALDLKNKRHVAAVCVSAMLCTLLTFAATFLIVDRRENNPLQYHLLAEAFANGTTQVAIDVDPALLEMENPYDYELRLVETSYPAWDYPLYDGKYYVYTGVVPELLFFYPYYMATGEHFPAIWAIRIPALLTTLGTFYLLYQTVRRFFPKTSLGRYLLLTFTALSSYGLFHYWMYVTYAFYTIPTIVAIACTIWGLGLWLDASVDMYAKRVPLKLFAASLLIAMVAGCRPQLELVAFLSVPLFLQPFFARDGLQKKQRIRCMIAFGLPFVAVAAGLMYYNYVRFDSPFDFGIKYLLTRNDMTHSGYNAGRLWDGYFSYLFQPFKIIQYFPFMRAVTQFAEGYDTAYLGQKISEPMYGGAFYIKPFLLVIFAFFAARKGQKEKKIAWLAVLLIVFGVIITGLDTQVGGILYRYVPDYLWLFALGACLICLMLWEKWESDGARDRALTAFVLFGSSAGMLLEFFIQCDFELLRLNGNLYYGLMSMFV